MSESLSAPYALAYTYRRSLGPVMSSFFSSLREGRILGARTKGGRVPSRVIVPPSEWDPESGDAIAELVEVGTAGVVVTWTWVARPRAGHPLQRPFAFALVKLDGADTAMLHAVDADERAMRTGLRVRARFRPAPEREGGIRDIECFEVES